MALLVNIIIIIIIIVIVIVIVIIIIMNFTSCPLVKLVSFHTNYQTLMIAYFLIVYILVTVDHGWFCP